MDPTTVAGEGKVSGNQASIPAPVRHTLDIEDGDVLRWEVVDGELRVTVLHRAPGAFDGFEPGTSDRPVDVVAEHDRFGLV